MEEITLPSPLASLRPHHALCLLFFEGKGYSQAFVENMWAVAGEPSHVVQITPGCDTLCQACPHNQDGICDDEAKVSLFDERALNLTGSLLDEEQPIPLNELCLSVYENILQQGKLAEVCGECEWADLCQEKWQRGDFNRQLLQSDLPGSHPS